MKREALAQFESYLRDVRGLSENSIRSRTSDCDRLAYYEGDLDAHFNGDGMEDLLARLTYSTDDQRRGLPPRHRVPINGNIRNGTATLKSAATLYWKFRRQERRPRGSDDRPLRPILVRQSRSDQRTRASATAWPDWQQPDDADILKLAHVLTPLVKFLHPDIVAAVAEDNQRHLSDWRSKLEQVGIDADIYLWNGSPCAFPGVRRYAGSQETAWYRKRTVPTDFTPPHCLRLDDNDCPKHLWAFVFTGGPFRKKGPREYQLAHLADHKEHNNRWREEFSLDSEADPPLLFGLYTSPANAAYVPKNFLQPTDVIYPLRALLLKQAYRLYGQVCRLAPPPLTEKALDNSAWNPAHFTWGDPVGDARNLVAFLEYRQEEFDNALDAKLADAGGTPTRSRQSNSPRMPPDDAHRWKAEAERAAEPQVEAPQESAHDTANQTGSWAMATELAAEPLHAAMRQWAAAGLPAPVPGFELTDDKGQVLAEAELAWPTQHIAVLHGEQRGKAALFRAKGWRICRSDDNMAEQVISTVAGWHA